MMRAVFACALLLGAGACARAEQPHLGRLFSTPEQRAQLDAQRYGPPPGATAPAAPAPPPPPPPAPPVELNGVVQRSSGRSTIWLNQSPQQEPHNQLDRASDGVLTLRLSTGQVLLLKPGQRYDPASGSVSEAPEGQP